MMIMCLIVRGLIVRRLVFDGLDIIFDMESSMDVLERFGHRVREKRTGLGLSQEEFAAKCSLDRTYISGIERGNRNVGLRNINVIAKSLGITIAELMSGL